MRKEQIEEEESVKAFGYYFRYNYKLVKGLRQKKDIT